MSDPRVAARAARFGEVADRYERARPLYAEAALSELAARCRLRPGMPVADLGAGTGKLTRQLVALGADVVAIEPAAGMRRRSGPRCTASRSSTARRRQSRCPTRRWTS